MCDMHVFHSNLLLFVSHGINIMNKERKTDHHIIRMEKICVTHIFFKFSDINQSEDPYNCLNTNITTCVTS